MTDETCSPQSKSSKWYLLCRTYCVLAALAFLACWAAGLYDMLCHGRTTFLFIAIPMALLVMPVIYMLVCSSYFPLSYGVFGRYSRRAVPGEEPVQTVGSSWIRFGRANRFGFDLRMTPGITWLCFREGIGFRIPFIGEAYLPAEHVTGIGKDPAEKYFVYHSAPDIFSPIIMPGTVYSALLCGLDEHLREHLAG